MTRLHAHAHAGTVLLSSHKTGPVIQHWEAMQVSSIGSSSKFLANQMKIPPLCFFFDKRVSPSFIQSKRSGPIAGKPTGPSSLSRQRKRLGIGNPYLHFISP
jgi:hypothetical protein